MGVTARTVDALERPGGRRRRTPIQKGSHKWRCMMMRAWGKGIVRGMPKHMIRRVPKGYMESAESSLWWIKEMERGRWE